MGQIFCQRANTRNVGARNDTPRRSAQAPAMQSTRKRKETTMDRTERSGIRRSDSGSGFSSSQRSQPRTARPLSSAHPRWRLPVAPTISLGGAVPAGAARSGSTATPASSTALLSDRCWETPGTSGASMRTAGQASTSAGRSARARLVSLRGATRSTGTPELSNSNGANSRRPVRRL
jgi:hypothetical protein